MPIVFNEPISFLQRLTEYVEYSELLDEAVAESDPIKRMEVGWIIVYMDKHVIFPFT